MAFRAIVAAGSAAVASATVYCQFQIAEFRKRDDMATEFLDVLPEALAQDENLVEVDDIGGCGCRAGAGADTTPSAGEGDSNYVAIALPGHRPSLLQRFVDVVEASVITAVLDGTVAAGSDFGTTLAYHPSHNGDGGVDYTKKALRSVLRSEPAFLLLDAIKSTKKPVLSGGIVCKPCTSVESGGQIVICSNRDQNVSEIKETSRRDAHLSKAERSACTEVRAYHLAMMQQGMKWHDYVLTNEAAVARH
eukprot:gene25108-33323_t